MASLTVASPQINDSVLQRLAREIAAGIHPVEDILKSFQLDKRAWDEIKDNGRFQTYLAGAIEEWSAAGNTQERVRVKAASVIELFLEESYKQLTGPEPLSSKNQLLTTLAKLAGMTDRAPGEGTGGEGFKITINLGADQKLTFSKELPSKVIEGEVVESS